MEGAEGEGGQEGCCGGGGLGGFVCVLRCAGIVLLSLSLSLCIVIRLCFGV